MPFARPRVARFRAGAVLVVTAVTAGAGFVYAQQSNSPLFYDQRRLPDMEVERRNQEVIGEQRRIADEKRRDAEALARKQAEDARMADEEKRLAAEAETKRKADEEKRLAAEAETKRKADEEKRLAAAAEAAKPQATKPQVAALVPAIVAPAVVATPAPATPLVTPAGACEPAKVSAAALPGGLAQITIDSPCRRSQTVAVHYGAFDLVRKLEANGHASFAIDLFLGATAPVQLGFADGSTHAVQLPAADFSAVSKIALIWQAPVDLDLHAIESGGAFGKAGHRWPGAASSLDATNAEVAASGHGAGYISTAGDGTRDGTRIEVYTFVHSPEQDSGAVAMFVDYASRGATPTGDKCGTGALAEIPFEVVVLDHQGRIRSENSLIPAQPCGVPLTPSVRYLRGAVPDLRFRN